MEASATAQVPARLKVRYESEIRPALIERFKYSSAMQTPKLLKVTLNMGVGEAKQDSKMLEQAIEQLTIIAGQKPNIRRARKSIAQFKVREEMPVGISCTLRGERAYEFLDRLTSVALPRVRDFRGLKPTSFDGRGNYSLGIREQIIFPEIDYDTIDQIRGFDVTITTTAPTDAECYALLEAFGFPFSKERNPYIEQPAAPEASAVTEAPAPAAPAEETEAEQPSESEAPTEETAEDSE